MKINKAKRTITSSRGNAYRIPTDYRVAKVRVIKQTMPSYKEFMLKLKAQLARQLQCTQQDMLLFSNQFHIEGQVYIECVLCLAQGIEYKTAVTPSKKDKTVQLVELETKLKGYKHPKKSKRYPKYLELCELCNIKPAV